MTLSLLPLSRVRSSLFIGPQGWLERLRGSLVRLITLVSETHGHKHDLHRLPGLHKYIAYVSLADCQCDFHKKASPGLTLFCCRAEFHWNQTGSSSPKPATMQAPTPNSLLPSSPHALKVSIPGWRSVKAVRLARPATRSYSLTRCPTEIRTENNEKYLGETTHAHYLGRRM